MIDAEKIDYRVNREVYPPWIVCETCKGKGWVDAIMETMDSIRKSLDFWSPEETGSKTDVFQHERITDLCPDCDGKKYLYRPEVDGERITR